MRGVVKKRLGENSEMDWLIKAMDEELKSWGYPGGDNEALIFKSEGERSMVPVKEALAKDHAGGSRLSSPLKATAAPTAESNRREKPSEVWSKSSETTWMRKPR